MPSRLEDAMFDVFLAHNTSDKPQVRIIAQKLKQRGLKPWLDEEQIPPGERFQEAIQKAIPQIKSAAIFIGQKGIGKWQEIELQTLTSQFVKRDIKVIPILLPGIDKIPDNLLFLQQFNWVSFEDLNDKITFAKLEWGITGIRPDIFDNPQTDQDSNVKQEQDNIKPNKQSILNRIFEFDMVTVNAQGKEIKREQKQAEYFPEKLGKGITLDMVYIPGGKFLMGTEEAEVARLNKEYDTDWFNSEKPQHQVTVSPFYMGKYPITQAQWKAIASLSKVTRDLKLDPANFKGDNLPVENISWYDALEFCQRLSIKSGKEYRLPSEAEWEYACRAGTTTPFHFGETISTDLANYQGTDFEYEGKFYPGNYGQGSKGIFRKKTTSVGHFKVANNFGLYDLHGNVCEWCADNWHEDYQNAPKDSRSWSDSGDDNRSSLRGGSWYGYTFICRSAGRSNAHGEHNDIFSCVGFRVVFAAGKIS